MSKKTCIGSFFLLSKAEIHTAEDYLNTDSAHIIALKGLGAKTVEKLNKLIQKA